MSDVSMEDQAALAIVFEENIRELVRKHLKAALEDQSFMGSINAYHMAQTVIHNLNPSNTAFRSAVINVITQQMNRY